MLHNYVVLLLSINFVLIYKFHAKTFQDPVCNTAVFVCVVWSCIFSFNLLCLTDGFVILCKLSVMSCD
jgi:hypothetical protein